MMQESMTDSDREAHGARGSSELADAAVASTELVDVKQLSDRYSELRLTRPGVVALLRRSIERNGLLRPLVVNLGRDGKLVVLDGLKRLRALRELNIERALVHVVQLDEAAALIAVLQYNTPHRGMADLEQAWVLRSLVRSCGLAQKRVAELIGVNKSWVSRRLALCEQLDDSLQQAIRLGLLTATMARELVRLPRGNQMPVAQAVRQHHLSCRQCAKLCDHALRCRDVRAFDALLRNPWPKLIDKKAAEPCRDPRLGEAAEALRRHLVALEHAAGALDESLQQHLLACLSSEERGVLGVLAATARERYESVIRELDDLFTDEVPS
jgi:ParB/RepB/Spo0J family partition protein